MHLTISRTWQECLHNSQKLTDMGRILETKQVSKQVTACKAMPIACAVLEPIVGPL